MNANGKGIVALFLPFFAVSGCTGATYYVAPTGSPTADGSLAHPWPSIQYALDKVGGGNTIIVRPGEYSSFYVCGKPGSPASPTIIRSEVKWKAVIRTIGESGIQTCYGNDWTVIDGFEVLGAKQTGIYICGANNTVRNCWVHNNGSQGILCGVDGLVLERNLVEFNGQHPQFHHGIYVHGNKETIRNNIVRHNAGYGMHLYPTLTNSTITGNVVHGHASKAGILVYCPAGGGRTLIANNTVVDNNQGLDVNSAYGAVVANNIVTGNTTDQIATTSGLGQTLIANITSGDPKFVDANKEVYWLQATSPAIGKGIRAYAPTTDFWDRPVTVATPDIGAYPYVYSLTQPGARSTWLHQWPYRFVDSADKDLPDLWQPPAIVGPPVVPVLSPSGDVYASPRGTAMSLPPRSR